MRSPFFGGRLEMREPREVRDPRRRRGARARRARADASTTPRGTPRGRWCSAPRPRRASRWSSPATRCSPARSGAPTCPAATTEQMMRSLRDKLLTRDDDTVRAARTRPGHDDRAGAGVEPVPVGLELQAAEARAVTAAGPRRQRHCEQADREPTCSPRPRASRSTSRPSPPEFAHVRSTLQTAADRAGYGLHRAAGVRGDRRSTPAASASRPTSSARRCTPSPTAATAR